METQTFTARFQDYLTREVAQRAAKTIADGSEIEFQIPGHEGAQLEQFTFTKESGKNRVNPGAARDPQVIFTVTPQAAEQILAESSDEVGAIGVSILKLIISQDPARKVSFKIKNGFLVLFSKGYFGVLTSGGGALASFLASHGLNGMSAIKAAFKRMRE